MTHSICNLLRDARNTGEVDAAYDALLLAGYDRVRAKAAVRPFWYRTAWLASGSRVVLLLRAADYTDGDCFSVLQDDEDQLAEDDEIQTALERLLGRRVASVRFSDAGDAADAIESIYNVYFSDEGE